MNSGKIKSPRVIEVPKGQTDPTANIRVIPIPSSSDKDYSPKVLGIPSNKANIKANIKVIGIPKNVEM